MRAIAQTSDGAMWFGTEAGLAKFDGRRTQTINDSALPPGRVLALQVDQDGAMWVGTESGAARFSGGTFERIKETSTQAVSAIVTTADGTFMSTEQGNVFECRVRAGAPIETRSLLSEPLRSSDRERPGPLTITSITKSNNRLFVGTLSRGVLEIDNGAAKEPPARAVVFFVNALERDKDGKLWAGGRAKKEEPGAFTGTEPSNLKRTEAATGPVVALKSIGDELWIGTDGRGVFRVSKTKTQRFTFDGTAGGLRSDHVYAIFADREGVIWFGTDRGVCRYDPHAPRVESVGDNFDSNFIRALYQTESGKTIAGTNRGLFVYDEKTNAWTLVPGLGQNIIYAVAEDRSQRLLVAAVSGFYVSPKQSTPLEEQQFARLESGATTADGAGSVRAIAQFNNATYYAIFGRGVERIDGGRTSLTWTNGTPGSREVLSLLADGDARLLIGTAKDGVLVTDGKTVREDVSTGNESNDRVEILGNVKEGDLVIANANDEIKEGITIK